MLGMWFKLWKSWSWMGTFGKLCVILITLAARTQSIKKVILACGKTQSYSSIQWQHTKDGTIKDLVLSSASRYLCSGILKAGAGRRTKQCWSTLESLNRDTSFTTYCLIKTTTVAMSLKRVKPAIRSGNTLKLSGTDLESFWVFLR